MTVTVIATLIARSARSRSSLTLAVRLSVPLVPASGVTVTIEPLCVTVAVAVEPAWVVTPSTEMTGAGSGLVT